MYAIYQIRNLLNGKVYVGSTRNVTHRWSHHKSYLRRGKHGNQHLQRAWNKDGEINFIFEILEEITDINILISREQWYLDTFKTTGVILYNVSPIAAYPVVINRTGRPITEAVKQLMREGRNKSLANRRANHILYGTPIGTLWSEESKKKQSLLYQGRPSFFLGRKHSEESKKKMSLANKGNKYGLGYKHSEEEKQKMLLARKARTPAYAKEIKRKQRDAHLGKKCSEETKRKLSEARKGTRVTEETRKNMSLAQKGKAHPWQIGKPRTEETKRKLSKSHIGMGKGIILSEEHKRKISAALKGHKCSEETKQKIREANSGKHMTEENRIALSKRMLGNILNVGRKHSTETKK